MAYIPQPLAHWPIEPITRSPPIILPYSDYTRLKGDLYSVEHQQEMMQAARVMISWGWAILPTNGKVPVDNNWQHVQASAQQLQHIIDRLSSGTANNLGIATGANSGIMVLDVDVDSFTKNGLVRGGWQVMQHYIKQYGPLPTTFTVRTGKGLHYYFKYDPQVGVTLSSSANKLVEGYALDFRSNGGQIITVPSIHANGYYYQIVDGFDRARQVPIVAEMPAWLKALINKQI